MTSYLDLEDLLRLTRDLGSGPVRDPGLLEAAAARPRATVFGDDAYPGLEMKAAALMHSVCRNHALVDGNKPLAWLAAMVFLDINGVTVEAGDDDAFDMVMRIAEGTADVPDVAAFLTAHAAR